MINELPLETYLEAVVPSEMPSGYHKEALKAQAVCARTYAWKQMQEGRLSKYGADVDDSVNYQVYQNIAPQQATSEADQGHRRKNSLSEWKACSGILFFNFFRRHQYRRDMGSGGTRALSEKR